MNKLKNTKYQIMLNHLLGAIIGHIDNEIRFTFKKEYGRIDIIEETKKLEPREFGAFGCRVKSFEIVLQNFEEYLKNNKKLLPGAYENYMAIKTLSHFYDLCEEQVKKEKQDKEKK